MTASNDRRLPRRRARRWRFLQLLLVILVLAPGMAMQSPVAPVRADALSDAVAEQQQLAKLIADQKAQLTKLSAQQTSLKAQIASTQQNLTGVRTSIDEAQAEITGLQNQLGAVQARYDGLVAQQVLLQTRLDQLTNEQDAKQRELDVRQQILAARLIAAYQSDQTPLLQQILTAHSLTDALSDVSYYGALSQADKAMADEIRSDQETLAQIRQTVDMANTANELLKDQVGSQRQALDAEKVQLATAQNDLAALKAQLETQLAQQQAADAKLAKSQAALDAAIRSNGVALDQLGSRIDQLVSQDGAAGKIPSKYSGTLRWPMGGVITQEFGCTGVPSEPRVRQLRPLPSGHRRRRAVLDSGLLGRCRRGRVRRIQPLRRPASGLARDHRPLDEHGHLVRAHDGQGAGRDLRRSVGGGRAARGHREHHGPLHGLPPALGRPRQRRLHEPAAVPVDAGGPRLRARLASGDVVVLAAGLGGRVLAST